MGDHRESVFLCPQEDDCAEFVEGNEYGITFFTKARQEEAHNDDTVQVNNNFTPFYFLLRRVTTGVILNLMIKVMCTSGNSFVFLIVVFLRYLTLLEISFSN